MGTLSSRLDATLLHNILELCQFFFALCVAIRAFFLYGKTHNERLFLLWLALMLFSLTSMVSIVGDNRLLPFLLNTNWLKYSGQTISFFFIWLSGFERSDHFLHRVKLWLLVSFLSLMTLLSVTPFLPPLSNPWLQVTLSSLRAVVCLLIFLQYVRFFLVKATRFSLLMGITFLLLSFGYYVIFPKYLVPDQDILSMVGDGMRIGGFLLLCIASFLG
jgi:hypothetical protein